MYISDMHLDLPFEISIEIINEVAICESMKEILQETYKNQELSLTVTQSSKFNHFQELSQAE